MIVEGGVSSFSIPLLAERLGFPRATIYKFFPTPYAVFNELALREVSGLEAHLLEVMQHVAPEAPWSTALTVLVNPAAAYSRPEDPRVGKECGRTCNSRGSRYHSKKKGQTGA